MTDEDRHAVAASRTLTVAATAASGYKWKRRPRVSLCRASNETITAPRALPELTPPYRDSTPVGGGAAIARPSLGALLGLSHAAVSKAVRRSGAAPSGTEDR
jgi:hypothetical protein